MKRILFATVAVIACSGAPAHAQLAVICPTCASEFAQVASWGKQAADMVRQLQQMRQQYEMLTATYNALAHSTDAFQVAGILGGATRTYMPEAGQALSLFSGSGTLWGAANSLMTASRRFDMSDGTPEGEEMVRRERSTANFRAVGFAGMTSAQESIGRLSGLIARITGAADVADIAAVNATIATEQQNLGNHEAQLAQTQLVLLTENRVDQQRDGQLRYESAQALQDATRPLTGSLR